MVTVGELYEAIERDYIINRRKNCYFHNGRVWGSPTNSLAEGRNGRGLVVLDVEEAVQLGDIEQVTDPLAEAY